MSLSSGPPWEPPKTSMHVSSVAIPDRARAAARSPAGAGTGRPVMTYRSLCRPGSGKATQLRRWRAHAGIGYVILADQHDGRGPRIRVARRRALRHARWARNQSQKAKANRRSPADEA